MKGSARLRAKPTMWNETDDMKLLKTAIYRGFLTQVVAWGLFCVLELEFLHLIIRPGFLASHIIGDAMSLAVILAVNWFLFTMFWLVLLAGASLFFPHFNREPLSAEVPDNCRRGYCEE